MTVWWREESKINWEKREAKKELGKIRGTESLEQKGKFRRYRGSGWGPPSQLVIMQKVKNSKSAKTYIVKIISPQLSRR